MKRKYQKIKNFPGIYRVLVSMDGKKWVEPERGSKFAAARYEGNGKSLQRLKRHFDSFDEAKSFKEDRMGFANLDQSPADGMTLRELFSFYEANQLIHRAINTQDKYKSYCRFFLPLWDRTIKAIGPIQIDSWLAWLKSPEQRALHSTRRCNFEHEYTFLKVLLGYYHETIDYEYRMPFLKRHKENLKIKEIVMIQKDLTPDQVRRFFEELKKADDDFYYYLAGMQYFSFSRIQDVVALHYEDFDFAAGSLKLDKKIIFRRVKDCTRELIQGSKSSTGKRITLSPQLIKLFREWTLKAGVRHGPLFRRDDGWPSYRSIQHAYDKAFKNADIPFSGTHILRHASLSEAQEASGDIKITQTLAGHKNISTTDRYAKARNSRIKEVQMQVGERIFTRDGSQ